MSISTNANIHYFGTQTSLDDSSADVTNGSFSVAGDLVEWTNSDNAPQAIFVLEVRLVSAGDTGSTIDLFCSPQAIGSSGEDSEDPDANFKHIYLGSFPCDSGAGLSIQYVTFGVVNLPEVETSQGYKFFILNNTGQTIDAPWDLSVTPITEGPHG